jgi:hypothetical protein
MNTILTLEEKESIVEKLKIRSSANLRALSAPKKPGLFGAMLGKLGKTEQAAKVIQDDVNAIIKEMGIELSEESRNDLVEFIKPTVKNLLVRFIQPK